MLGEITSITQSGAPLHPFSDIFVLSQIIEISGSNHVLSSASSVAVSYSEYQDEVRVVPVYTPGMEYLETINQASLQGEEVPDLYIVSNDSLEKAYLAGLACEVKLPEGVPSMEEMLPETAVRSVTYHDKQIGYPFYYETSCLLYNRTYLEEWAKAQIVAERDQALAEDAQEQADSGEVEEEIQETQEEHEVSEEEIDFS